MTSRAPHARRRKVAEIAALGATPVVVDALDVQALAQAVAEAQRRVVIHQLTDLPDTVTRRPWRWRACAMRNCAPRAPAI